MGQLQQQVPQGVTPNDNYGYPLQRAPQQIRRRFEAVSNSGGRGAGSIPASSASHGSATQQAPPANSIAASSASHKTQHSSATQEGLDPELEKKRAYSRFATEKSRRKALELKELMGEQLQANDKSQKDKIARLKEEIVRLKEEIARYEAMKLEDEREAKVQAHREKMKRMSFDDKKDARSASVTHHELANEKDKNAQSASVTHHELANEKDKNAQSASVTHHELANEKDKNAQSASSVVC